MTTEEIYNELTTAWMADSNAANLFGFVQYADFASYYSKVGVVSLILWVTASVIAAKETVIGTYKDEVRAVANATHYGSEPWWVSTAKAWQAGSALTEIDGQMGYATVNANLQVVTAAAVTTIGRTLRLKVAKTVNGELTPLTESELSEFTTYANRIKPMGITLAVTSMGADNVVLTGTIRYRGEYLSTAINSAVAAAAAEYASNLEFGATLYLGALAAAMMAVEGVEDVHLTGAELNEVAITDYSVLPAGYAKVNISGMTLSAI